MADIKTINGNPIVLDSSGLEDEAVIGSKIAEGAVGLMHLSFGAFEAATEEEYGEVGLVPGPSYSDRDNVLWGNGTWGAVIMSGSVGSSGMEISLDRRYSSGQSATSTNLSKVTIPMASWLSSGLMSPDDKSKLDDISDAGIEAFIDNWLDEHPEVITTVQDDSLTTQKYKDGSVTPEKLSGVNIEGRMLQSGVGYQRVNIGDSYADVPLMNSSTGLININNIPMSPLTNAEIDAITQ